MIAIKWGKTVRAMLAACVLMVSMPGAAAAACGAIPSSYPVLSGDKLEVGKASTVNDGTTTSAINGGKKYDGNLDAINPANGAVLSVSASYPGLDPTNFPSTGTTDTSAATVAAGSYDDITVAQSATTTFTGGTYYIDKLDVGKSATVSLAAGSYFINQLSLDEGAKIVVSSEPVRLYIGTEVTGDDDLLLNSAGTVGDFQVFLYPDADWKVDKDVTFVGVIYAPGTSSDIEFDDNSSIRGALVTAGEVKLGQDTSLSFNADDQAAVAAVTTCATTAVAPSGFNAFETGTTAGSVNGVIRTKVAASAFSLDIVALKTGGTAIETAFAGAVKLELVDASGAASCSAYGLIRTLGTLTFAATDQGRKTFSGISEADAWRNVRIRVSYPATGTPTIVACSTDNFAIRPSSFGSLTASDGDSSSAGLARMLNNTDAIGGYVHKAGRPFTVTAAVLPASATNYSGSPTATVSSCIGSGCPATLGTVSLGGGAASGSFLSTSASYSEVGAFRLQLQDQTFAAVDADDTSGDCTASGRYVCSSELDVGRFVPDHFELAFDPALPPRFKTFNDATCATRSFTYVGQPFGYVTLPQATITAKNASSVTTTNYAGTLWKLTAADATQTYAAASGTLDTGLIDTPVLVETGSGVGRLTANAADVVAFDRSTPVVPFNALIDLTMSVSDASESAVTGNGTIDTTTPALFDDIAFDAGNEIRFGRLALANAHGSELLALPMLIEAQYWTSAGFAPNTADHCTQLSAGQVALSTWRRNLVACETSVTLSGRFASGRGNLRLGKPGDGNTGSVDLTVNLDAVGGGSGCVGGTATPATGAAQSWLQGNWNGGAYTRNPAARASFGLHRASRALIYIREMY